MAASIAQVPNGIKLSKSERRAMKKHLRSQHTLFRHENINLSNEASQHIVVGNGGLGNNVQREELVNIFSKYGKVVDVLMKPRKPYAFITFSTVQEGLSAFREVHGRTMKCPEQLSVPNVTFYLSFIKEVPGFEAPTMNYPPGLILLENAVSKSYEQELLKSISWDTPEASTNSQTLKHRRVKHYGYEFIYGINNVNRNKPLKEGIPPICEQFLINLMDSNYISCHPDQLTVNQYEPGQGIPPHIDTHSAFEDGIISLSLGSQVVMDFRHPDGRHYPVLLPQRSAIIMTGESRYLWTHGITPRKSDVVPVSELSQQKHLSDPGVDSTEAVSDHGDGLTLFRRNTRTSFTFRKVLHGACKCNYPERCDREQKHSAEGASKFENKDNTPSIPDTDREAELLEKLHVHEVYEEIADHFSDTRHKAWPKVAEFVRQQPTGSILIDVGCGNGKYLGINSQIYKVGCDRSMNLCLICAEQSFEVLVADVLALPYRDSCCDVAISIAVIHHLSTQERRIRAIGEIIRVLQPGGKALISVWAFEQELNKQKSNYLKESRIRRKHLEKTDDMSEAATHSETLLNKDMCSCCSEQRCRSLEVHTNRTPFDKQDLLVPWHKKPRSCSLDTSNRLSEKNDSGEFSLGEKQAEPIYHRFYHVFKEGELNELVRSVPNVRVTETYYDKGNWCVILEKTEHL